uniref:Teretoxin Tan6.1 n=1 Tax=Terebra anilis TaxID=553697 RepID=T61_TERAN|nr:RecName: Full=Teretoxin Tan6.1; Flags: Precursor [Terebra anilis]
MATSGRLLCLCLVLGLVFESLGHPGARLPKDGKRAVSTRHAHDDPFAHEVNCGGFPCMFSCCENDVCMELNCEYFPSLGQ